MLEAEARNESLEEAQVPTLPIVVKADAQGSLEAIENALKDFPEDQIELQCKRLSCADA